MKIRNSSNTVVEQSGALVIIRLAARLAFLSFAAGTVLAIVFIMALQ